MVQLNTEIIGVKEVMTFLRERGDQQQQDTAAAINKATLFMEAEVKSSIAGQRNEPASVDTGRFLNSINSTITLNDEQLQGMVYTIIDYAQYLEYGTSFMDARHHFGNSLDRNRQQILSFFAPRQ